MHTITLKTYMKFSAIGILLGESFFFGQTISVHLSKVTPPTVSLGIILFLSLILPIYIYARTSKEQIKIILESKRIDLLISTTIGAIASWIPKGFGSSLYAILADKKYEEIILSCIFIVTSFSLLWIVSKAYKMRKDHKTKTSTSSFFIDDSEKTGKDQDLLGLNHIAKKFSERVFNNGSLDNLVFGLEAPWGTGKSSFINLCFEYWKTHHKNNVVTCKFNPTIYTEDCNILEKLITEITQSIQKSTFLPELKPLATSYSTVFSKRGTISLFGLIDLYISPEDKSIDDKLQELSLAIESTNKKIIVVVDDLDRLPLPKVKSVLHSIKQSFSLPCITYILCYDVDNISFQEEHAHDPDRITEFLEKFVNIKLGIYLTSEKLASCLIEHKRKILPKHPLVSPRLVSNSIEGLLKLYRSDDYYRYAPFIGDIRKIKRLLNIILILDIDKVDFEHTDINKEDLIHLLLIYLHYPSLFRTIYNSETGRNRGLFSALTGYDSNSKAEKSTTKGGTSYKNSAEYFELKEALPDNQRFLVERVFEVSSRIGDLDDTDENFLEEISSLACLNVKPKGPGNLESYLSLITNISEPSRENQQRFYLKLKEKINSGEPITNILKRYDEFSLQKSEHNHLLLWRTLTNDAHNLERPAAHDLIVYLSQNLGRHSLYLDNDLSIGYREELCFCLLKMLEEAGWGEKGNRRNNSYENVREIADWIFGDQTHKNNGIIHTIQREDNGVTGLYTSLMVRLHCNPVRSSENFNITRALALRDHADNPITGQTEKISIESMREISQYIYSIFQLQYIEKSKNVLRAIDEVTEKEILGDWLDYARKEAPQQPETHVYKDKVRHVKEKLKLFIIYQLGNTSVKNGPGCGYYDQSGKDDNHGISKSFNDYLFNVCFEPKINRQNYKIFIEYIFSNITPDYIYGEKPHFNESDLTKVLDKDKLAKYWIENRKEIKDLEPSHINSTTTTSHPSKTEELFELAYKKLDEISGSY